MPKSIHSSLDFQGSARILNLPDGVGAQEPATIAQLNAAVEGIAWKDNCRSSTQGNLNLASPGATVSGVSMVSGDRFLVRAQTSQPENGIYIWNGASTPATRAPDASTANELEQAVVTIDEGADAGTTWRQTTVNFTLGTGNVVWTDFGTSVPAASESTAGRAEIATQAETDAGVDDLRFVTPLKLATWSGRSREVVQNIGDGTATQFDVTHNFGTRDVKIEVYRNASPFDGIIVEDSRPDANTARLNFVTAPTTNQFRAIVTLR